MEAIDIKQLSLSNKARLLYHLAVIKFEFNRHHFCTPKIMNTLCSILQIEYDNLEEKDKLHILMAY